MPRLSIRSATVSVSSPAFIAFARFSSGIPIIGSSPMSVVPCFKVFSKSLNVAIRRSHVAPRRSGAALSERLLARAALMRQNHCQRRPNRPVPLRAPRHCPAGGPFRASVPLWLVYFPSVTVLC